MAKEEKQEKLEFKTSVKMVKPFDYDKVYEINKLQAQKEIVEMRRQQLLKAMKDAKPEQIEQQLTNSIIRDNAFSTIMTDIVNNFEFDIDPKQIEFVRNSIKKAQPNIPDKSLDIIVDHTIKRDLVFFHLSRKWDLTVSNKEVKDSLQAYYKATNEPIREMLNDKQKFESVRMTIFNEKIMNEILKRFKIKINPELIERKEQTKN